MHRTPDGFYRRRFILSAPLCSASLCVLLASAAPVSGQELPWWLDSVEVTQPGVGGVGAITLSGLWIDTCIPDAISHSVSGGALQFEVTHPGINVACGDAITPWTLTEEFGPLDPEVNEIRGTLVAVDPADRSIRELVSGPDLLGLIFPPRRGEFHGLGALQPDAYVSAAFDVSADGRVVVGHNELGPGSAGLITSEAFAWSPSTGMFPLGLLTGGSPGGSTAFGVSADGNTVVGQSNSQTTIEGFRWTLGDGMQGLGTFEPGSSTSRAVAASHNGEVIVGSDRFFPPTLDPITAPLPFEIGRVFRWTEETGLVDLGQLFPGGSSEAADVSASGRAVTGTARINPFIESPPEVAFPNFSEPFRWTPETGMVGLGHLNFPILAVIDTIVPPQFETTAAAISADGDHVVGTSRVFISIIGGTTPPDPSAAFVEAAFLWTEETGMINLGQIPTPPGPQFVGAEATDVSGDGRFVVGVNKFVATDATDLVAPDEIAFIWDEARGMRSLQEVLEKDFGLDLENWHLGRPEAISDDGSTIVGTGINPDGRQEAWRAVLSRTVRPGDTDFDGDVDPIDLGTVQANMGMSSENVPVYWSYGDFDEDGVVGESDVQLFFANYDGRAIGDYDGDGEVTAADYTVWQDTYGSQTDLAADGNGDGVVNEIDRGIWRESLGLVVAGNSGGSALQAAAIPEPISQLLALQLIAAVALAQRRRRS